MHVEKPARVHFIPDLKVWAFVTLRTPIVVKGNTEEETGTEVLLEPEIKDFEQKTGNTEENAEKMPEQQESAGMPGFIIYGIIALLAALLYIVYKKK